MKQSRLALSVLVGLVLLSSVAFAGGFLTGWDDWKKSPDGSFSYRVRCEKMNEATKMYSWSVEVENNQHTGSNVGVALSKAGETAAPAKGWLTWPINGGGRHVFTGMACSVGPKEKIQVWFKTSNVAKPAAARIHKVSEKAPQAEKAKGKTFTACGKEWMLGKNDIDWTATQKWIESLGNGWRAPTRDELVALFKEVGKTSPIGQDYIWAEKRDAHSAWHFSFYYNEVRWGYFDDHSRYGRAVAVREQ